MFKKVLMTIGLLLMANFVLAQGTIKGTIIDSKTKEPVPFANVVAKQDGKQIKGTQTDMDGNFTLKPLNVGQYEIQASCVGYNTYTREDFTVKASGFSVCNIELSTASKTLEVVEIKESKNPIIDIGSAESGERVSAEAIAQMPGTSVENIVAAVGGVGYNDGGTGTARGEDGMVTNVGGVRKRTGVNVPKEAIAEIQVILGGTPASIGEAIGGTQIITLKPPSSQFKGYFSLESILDYRLWNRLTAYITGPVIKQDLKDENGNITGDRTLIGFRLTSQGTYQHNPFYRPRDRRYMVVNDDLVRQFEKAPISYDPVTGTTNYSAERGLYGDNFVEISTLSKKDFGGDASRVPHTASFNIKNNLSFDIRFSDYATLAITGDLNYSYGPNNSLMPLNMTRSANGVSRDLDWSVTVDFTQRFPDEEPTNVENTDGSSSNGRAIKNVMYNIVAMFERDRARSYNEVFGGDLGDVFKYGYIGRLVTEQRPNYELNSNYSYNGISRAAMVQNSWYDVIDWSTYEPYAPNQVLANYNLQLLNIPDLSGALFNIDMLRQFKGLANGDSPANIYGIIDNVGVQSTGFGFSQDDYIYVAAKASAEIKGHPLEIGFQYDRMDRSYYALGATGLWTIMRQNANRHISQMDLGKPTYTWEGSTLYVTFDRLLNREGQSYFDRAMRDYLGWSGDEKGEVSYLDIDRYTPEEYVKAGGLNMFSSDELFNNGSSLVSYYGYDHTGKKYNSSTWSLDDFFNPSDAKFRYIPAYTPTYMAGYIQDQFYFSDLIFNVGVRVDIFDANQSVLKDPYLLYDSWTVKDLKDNKAPYQGEIYSGAGDNWIVYVDAADADNPTIYGYRNGSTWYDANGVELNSPNSIAGKSGKPTPYRTPDGQKALTNNTVSSTAFEDYKPQVVVQPRIAFSFPVGENSQFKASYDIIARRPSGNWRAEYLKYLYMSQITAINNPNLKPERITNYELGFQQALNKNNAVSISAFYKETRDLIQVVQYAGADPNNNYYSYDNIDFKTTKGITISYDLRQSKNIRVNANYTLQYAEGTGLTGSTMQELIREGYTTLKMLNPISDDRRHEFKVNFDFRYLGGKRYNGPTITRKVTDKETGEDRQEVVKLLENFGIDITAVAQSGRPYTKAFSNTQSTIVGSYNGARLPWGFYLDLVIDKRFPIKIGKRESMLSIALSVYNVLDIRNTTSVWPVTGNPDDNGYLTDPETQSVIERYLDPDSFRDMYSVFYLNNSYWRYSTPRRFMATIAYSF